MLVIVKRGRPKNDGTFWYIDVVQEAMCFGWIDSTTKNYFRGSKQRKNWLPVNPKVCGRN